MTAVLVVCGLLTGGALTGCGQEAASPAEPPREVIEGNSALDSFVQTDAGQSIDETDVG